MSNTTKEKSKQITLNGKTIARRTEGVRTIQARFARKFKNLYWVYNSSWNYLQGTNPDKTITINIHNV